MTALAALAFTLAAAGAIAFQVALALGAPWGRYAMGGRFPGRLPPPMRVSAVVQAAVIAGLALVVLSSAGLAVPEIADAVPWLVWLPVGFSALSLALNLITSSAPERRLWAPVASVLLLTSVIVALGPG